MKVGIFRLQLFKASETFIAAQARHLPSMNPILVGRRLFGSPAKDVRFCVPDHMGYVDLAKFYATGSPTCFMRALSMEKIALVHAHFSVDGLYALPLARRLKVPLVTTLHGFDVTTKRTDFLRSGRPALVRYALLQDDLKQEGNLFICVSEFIRRKAIEVGFPEDRLVTHYIGIDPEQFSENAHADASSLVVLHVARLVETKGTAYLIDAFKRIAEKHARATLVIVGEGPLRTSLEDQAMRLGLAGRIRFLGAQSHAEVRRLMAEASVFALPSVTATNGGQEGLGLVLLEAAASGVPVVGTRHGGIPEAMLNERNGFLVKERDIEELAAALDQLLMDPGLRRRFGAEGIALVHERFDIRKQSHLLENHYRSVL